MAGSRDRVDDIESADPYKGEASIHGDAEHDALLPRGERVDLPDPLQDKSFLRANRKASLRSIAQLAFSFLGGVGFCLAAQTALCYLQHDNTPTAPARGAVQVLAPPYAGSSEVHNFPPPSPTNFFPSLFPTNVGYAGPTPTGAEPGLIGTAPSYPMHTGAPHLVSPFSANKEHNFDLFKYWGNLSPWFSVERGTFGLDSSPETPDTCRVTGLHLLHRHGARYPTQYGQIVRLLYVKLLLM